MMSGANYHISYCQVLESERRLKVSTILKLFSNQESSPTLAEFIKSFSGPTDESTTDTSLDTDLYISLVENLPIISLDPHTLQSLAFIGEYTVHQLGKHFSLCNDCLIFLTEDKLLYVDEPLESKFKLIELIDRGNLKWPSEAVIDAVIIVWKLFVLIERNDKMMNQFVSGSSRKILVELATTKIESVQSEIWRNKCVHCDQFGWNYLKRILTITSNCIISNKVKNFNSQVAFQSRG